MDHYLSEDILVSLVEKKNGENVLSMIRSRNRRYTDLGSNPQIANILAYALMQLSKNKNPRRITLEEFLNGKLEIREDVVTAIKDYVRLNSVLWKDLMNLTAEILTRGFAMAVMADAETYRKFSSRWAYDAGTKKSMILVAKSILDCNEEDTVLALCSGVGDFISNVAINNPKGKYYGFEIVSMNAVLSELRAELMGVNVDIRVADVFDGHRFHNKRKFSKIFSNYPLKSILSSIEGPIYSEMAKVMPGLTRRCSRDWAFNFLICKHIEEGGKAVAIMTNGSATNALDAPAREYFVKAGLIESIISLPTGITDGSNLSCCMVVFSHNNQSIKMVDASRVLDAKHRRYYDEGPSEKEIAGEILNACNNGRVVTKDEIEKKAFSLFPMHYNELDPENAFEDAITLAELSKDILRGTNLSGKELEQLVTKEDTGIKYVNLAAIQDGIISEELINLRELDPKQEKFCLMHYDVIISKTGEPFKVAVASVNAGEKVLIGGNVHIIRVDVEKIYPYYLAAFLESEAGQKLLSYKAVGSGNPVVGIDTLRALKIPVLDMKEQYRIGNAYWESLVVIKKLKKELKDALAYRKKAFSYQ